MLNRITIIAWLSAGLVGAETRPEGMAPIQTVEVGANAELRVNGKPFLPLMLWLQSDARIEDGLAAGVNTFAGNGGKLSEKEYLDALAAKGLYGVVSFEQAAIGHPSLLAWIHGDEPDLPRTVNDARITPGAGLRVNSSTPLERIVDGVPHSWSVLDPLQGAEVTIQLRESANVESVSLWLTVSAGLALAKDVSWIVEGREVLKVQLKGEKGEQRFRLEQPVRAAALTLRVNSTTPGTQEWGSISEVAAYDNAGQNVLLSPPRSVPRATAESVAAEYRKIKAADASRPVFVTFTAQFMKVFTKYDDKFVAEQYPRYMAACDVAGFDVYPIFGWNKPEWLSRVAEGVTELRSVAGPRRPLYAWIETNKGSKWVSADRQLDVRPEDTRAEVWMALIRGASGIGYFTHSWVPSYKQFTPTGDMVNELKRLNSQIAQLAPALLADPAKTAVTMDSGDVPSHLRATMADNSLYIFAQNIDMQRRPAKAVIAVPKLPAGAKIEVLDEHRTIVADSGRFLDLFAPLAEHIYRITPAPR